MNWYTKPYNPSLWGTLAEIWAVSRAIWTDYRDLCRARRRHARRTRATFTTPSLPTAPRPVRWHGDVLFVLMVCAVAVGLGLYSAGLLPQLWSLIVRLAAGVL